MKTKKIGPVSNVIGAGILVPVNVKRNAEAVLAPTYTFIKS